MLYRYDKHTCNVSRFYFHFILVLDILQAFFNTTIIALPFVGYQMNIANSAPCVLFGIYHIRRALVE